LIIDAKQLKLKLNMKNQSIIGQENTQINKKKVQGSLEIIISALFFASYGIWSRMMQGFFGEFNQAWIRSLLITIVVTTVALWQKKFQKIQKKDLPWFLLISLSAAFNQAPYYFAFQNLEVGTATMVFYSALTIGGFIFGALFFQEKIREKKLIALLLAILGLFLIYGLKLSGNFLALSMAAVAGLMGAVEVVFSKKVSDKYSNLQIMSFLFSCSFFINLIISLAIGEKTPTLALNSAWIGEIAYSVSMMSAAYFVFRGYQKLEPSIASLIGLLEIIFAVIFGLLLFAEKLSPGIVLGGILILISAALPNLDEKS
jgi:drug/metabolite transporter (DMT)-like permease